MTSATVSEIRRTGQFRPFADAHLSDSLIPALDHFALSNFELEWHAAVPAGIKFLPIAESTYKVAWKINYRKY